ncbi:MAG TPA: adenylate/guanylate cyclase domain-containing protein [Candidatus Dormibacteraeota bacterium]|nr:adenylate/guanylate cyclase domain-containing protein [Candidatus Dormibacteraeota bacterium]
MADVRGEVGSSERRRITVLFADIAGSTAIAERMDPEDWTAVVGHAFARMNATVERYDGTIARLMGDGLLAFFGAPIAHEDDPERAVRCALDMVKSIGELGAEHHTHTGIDLQVRVGINTGPVVVGIVGTDAANEYTAMGDAVNVAARMQSHAQPGSVFVTAETHRFIAPLVDSRDVGMLELKGKADAVHAFEVTRLKPGATSPRGLAGIHSPMIGRDDQLAKLNALFSVARARQGRIVSLLGEPGIGKSRMLAEFRAAIEAVDPSARWVEGRCLSYGQTLPYHVVLDLVRSLFGVSASADEPETRTALGRGLRDLLGESWAEPYSYLGHLLSIQLEPEMQARISALEGETMKRYVSSIATAIRAQSARAPVVLVCEDLHWADPASVDTLLALAPLMSDLPVVCIATSRVERSAEGWRLITGIRDLFGDALTEIRLDPLSNEDSRTLVANLLEIESLPTVTRELILTKAEGNPFFVEEVIRMLVDRGMIERQADRWIATERIVEAAIPDTLQGLLLARIDRLPAESRRTLRVASVIGRQFGVTLLERLLEAKTS